jgi:hypothetical protein
MGQDEEACLDAEIYLSKADDADFTQKTDEASDDDAARACTTARVLKERRHNCHQCRRNTVSACAIDGRQSY